MAALVAVVLAPLPAAASGKSTQDARIARIEQNLLPALQVRGRPMTARTLSGEMALHRTPALSVAVVDGGRIVWARAYGYADVAAKTPATTRTLFQAGSVSKPVAASGAMQLVQEGKLVLDRPANDQLVSWKIPDSAFTQGDPITLRHLLTHTAGLTVHGFPGYEAGKPVPTVVQLLEGKPPANTPAVVSDQPPGKVWNYSGGGITIAQLMITDVSHESFPALMRRRVFVPLGMADSTYEQPLPPERVGAAATGYHLDGKPVPGRFHTYPEMAAAGLWTTPTDLAKWAIALQRAHDGRSAKLMSKASARTMLTPGLGDWGIGIAVNGQGDARRFSHGGDDEGFKTTLVGWFTGGRAVVVMANGDDSTPLINEVAQAVAHEYGWKGLEPQVVVPAALSAAQMQDFAGSYGHGALKVAVADGRIMLSYAGQTFEAIPLGGDKFIIDGASQAIPADAVRGPDGKVKGISAVGLVLNRDP
ncbi:MAG: class A beta-lactamase-related serine hydrolase [Phenylobacterium sp.]|nr:MAG: class A beta-lactamase-related serine hydrolase [Phenylobacterium sp.]